MKKLGKLKLHDVKEISADEQKSIKGGDGYWVTGEDGNQYWYVGEIQIIAQQEPPGGWGSVCPACQRYHQLNEQNPMGRPETPVWNPFGEFITNTLAHILGRGDHINGSETQSIITMADGETIVGSN